MKRNVCRNWKTWTLVAAFVLLFPAAYAPDAVAGTIIHNVRTGAHGSYDRLVFDIEGARPSQLGPATAQGIVIKFQQAESRVNAEQLSGRLPQSVEKLTFQQTDQGLAIHITLRDPKTAIKTFFSSWRPGAYRLALDFAPQSTPPPPKNEEKASTPKKPEKTDTKKDARGKPAAQTPDAVDRNAKGSTGGSEKSAELFKIADNAFLAGQHNLFESGAQIIEQYAEAIKAGPGAPQVPLAMYRIALSYLAMGDNKKAEEGFKRVISSFPNHATVPMAWLHVARIQQQRRSIIESVQAFRTALTYPLPKEELTDTYYSLGKALAGAEAHHEAIESMRKCLEEDPTYYRKKPDMLKSLGESFFAIQQYGKSCESYFRYLNLQKEIPDRDVVLAKVAENLLYMGDNDLANKIYAYIERKHPDSEGDVIGKIRKAEILEQKDAKFKDTALAIYQELAQKSLSPPLSKLVLFRLATWEWSHGNYEKSQSLITEALEIKAATATNDEIVNLQAKVVADWIKQAYADKNYPQVLKLYQENKSQFQFWGSPEFDIMAAESYGNLKQYPNAAEIYQQVIAKSSKKNDEWLHKAAHYAFLMRDMDKTIHLALQIQSETMEAQKSELLAKAYFAQKKFKEAAQYFYKFYQNDWGFERGDTDTLISYVESLMQMGKYGDAVTTLQKASKKLEAGTPERQVQAILLQGKCYQHLKQTDKAIEVLERAAPLVTENEQKDQLNYQLSMLYLETGQEPKAKEKLSQLLQSSQSLWKAAAQQQLDYLHMQGSKPK